MSRQETRGVTGQMGKSRFLQGGGRMGAAILAFDWAQTSVGPLESWPVSLKAVVQMAVQSRQPICLFWGRERNLMYNDAYAPFLGQREAAALGQKFEMIWSDIWADIEPIVAVALSGEGTWSDEMPLTLRRNGYDEETYWSFSYSPLYDDAGEVAGMINIASDSTATVLTRRALKASVDAAQRELEHRAELDAQQRIIQREMAHRIKNILSMTMAVVSQTLRHTVDIKEANEVIGQRITALAEAQDVLTNAQSSNADMRALVEQAMKPHQNGKARVEIEGPPILVPSQHALGVALAIHELATNAVKYGALSGDAGVVSLRWSVDSSGSFALEWREQGGPPVTTPARTGFGSRLMHRIVPSYFAGAGQTHYHPDGVHYVLNGRIDQPEHAVSAAAAPPARPDF